MESLYKSVAIIGKYASGSESSDIESQLLELAQFLTSKHINIFIEAKTHQSGKFQAFKSITLEEIGAKADLAIVVGGDGTILQQIPKFTPNSLIGQIDTVDGTTLTQDYGKQYHSS